MSTLALMKAMRELVARHEQLTGMIVTTDFAPTNALLKGLSQSLKMAVGWAGWGRISHRPYEGSPG